MDPNNGEVNDDQSWPMPPGGFATVAPPRPRTVWRLRPWVIIRLAGLGVAVLVVLGHFLGNIYNTAGTTKSFRLVSPAPASAGGLVQDVAVESQPGYKARVAAARQYYAKSQHRSAAGSVFALYQGPATDPSLPAADNVVTYIGFPLQESADTSSAVAGAVHGFSVQLTNATKVPVSGGLGDTTMECVTGDAVGVAGQVTACVWATDRTIGLLLRPGPDPGAKKLSAIMLKMWPHLVHR